MLSRKIQMFVFSYLLLVSCGQNDAQQRFEQKAYQVPNAFTETNFNGEIIQKDPDDWRISPIYATTVEIFRPAFPNPSSGQNYKIELLITGINAVEGLSVFVLRDDRTLSLIDRYAGNFIPTGLFVINIEPSSLALSGVLSDANGLSRILVADGLDRIITYGDVKFE